MDTYKLAAYVCYGLVPCDDPVPACCIALAYLLDAAILNLGGELLLGSMRFT